MTENKYNGWTNYATWRVNLEMFDQWELGDFLGFEDIAHKDVDVYELSQYMREYAEERINEDASADSFALSYAYAFLSDVNWYEIAESMVKAQIAENDYKEIA